MWLSSIPPPVLSLLWVLLCDTHTVAACTVFIVGKDASTDGSVMVSHSNDGEFDTDPRLVKVPARSFPEGTSRPVYFSPEAYPRYVGTERGIPEYYPRDDNDDDASSFEPIGSIPQVPHTFAYIEETYGAINERQVGIGESTCSGIFGATPLGAPNGTALWSIDELTHVAMERATTARDAIVVMGQLAEEGGFYGAGEFEGTAESLAVSDPNEAWIFHILPDPTGTSAIWAAQKVPDDSFAVLANMFVIREVDPNDSEQFLMSDSVHQVAQDYGWWSPDDDGTLLDFTKIYSDGEYAHKYYSGRRMWGGYHLAAPSRDFPTDYIDLQSDPVYPVHVPPDDTLSVQDIMRFHRYTYQGTEFDLGAEGNLASGPFGTPDRWTAGEGESQVPGNWERAIGLYRTSDTYIVQSSTDWNEGVLWFAPASPLGSIFTPFTVSLADIPVSFRSGHQQHFDRSSAFWAACIVHNVANLKWSYMIKDVQAVQDQLESESVTLVHDLQTKSSSSISSDDWGSHVEHALVANADKTVPALQALQDQLLFKYASGFVNEWPDGEMSQVKGYPAWWLQAVGYPDGPPPPPTEPKCCDPGPGSSHSNRGTTTNAIVTGKAAMRQFLKQS